MRVLILGAAGMLGAKLAARLVADGRVGNRPIAALTLVDVAPPVPPAAARFPCEAVVADPGGPGEAARLAAGRPDVVFHLAAVVSGEAEADLAKGYAVNLDGARGLFDAVRAVGDGYRPRVVFASSLAVFGAPFPEVIPDDFHLTPLTSYGAQKAMGELLLADYTRRGFLDGVGVRLPTICVRPGRPNRAASGFFSGIIREPLNGQEAVLPVGEDVRHWFASPRAAVGFLLRAAALPGEALGPRRSLTMPGVSTSVGEQLESLARFGGREALRLVRREPDPTIAAIVAGWPRAFDAARARALGFVAEESFDAIVRAHVEDELGGRVAA